MIYVYEQYHSFHQGNLALYCLIYIVSKPSAVANAKPGDTFEEDGIVYKMADEEPEYDEEADDDDNYTPERTASDDNMEAVANLNEKIEQEAATSKK